MPYNGTAGQLEDAVRTYHNKIDSRIEGGQMSEEQEQEKRLKRIYQLMLADAFSE